jgi:serine/threonine-protein kinase
VLELIGRYRIQEKIGEGAMADVYRAHDPSINRSLAIKVLKGEFRQNPEYSTRFLREAKAAGALSHRNIVTIYDVGEIDGYPYIVMELLEGEPLNEVMQRLGKLPADQVMSVGQQLADALRYAHRLGVIHRDIKPSNVMFDSRDGSIKLLDFGIARIKEADSFLETDSVKTQIGQVLGTPRYMSPEQALGQEIDGRSDLFSVGVILYELITGKKAFGGVSAATLALQITQQDPEPIAKLAPESPRGLQFIVNKLLAKKPERRFADGAQLSAALRQEQSVYDAVKAEAASQHKYLPLQVRLTLALGVITAVVLAGAIATVLVRQDKALEQMAIASGSGVTSFVANNAALQAADNATLPPEQRDWAPISAFVNVAAKDPNVEQITVVDADGVVRGSSDATKLGKPYLAPTGEKVVKSSEGLTVTDTRSDKGQSFRFMQPITFNGRVVGKVDVSLSKSELQAASAVSKALLSGLGLVILGVILVATYVLSRQLADPIKRLKAAFAEAGRGNLDFRISHSRRDEFGELFEGFNRFAGHVQERMDTVEAVALDRTILPEGDTSIPPGLDTPIPRPEDSIIGLSTADPSPFSPPPPAEESPVEEPPATVEAAPEPDTAAAPVDPPPAPRKRVKFKLAADAQPDAPQPGSSEPEAAPETGPPPEPAPSTDELPTAPRPFDTETERTVIRPGGVVRGD